MSKPRKKLETNNDFWNDCLKENKKPKKFLNTKINPSPNYLNRAKRNKKLYRHDTNQTCFSSKITFKCFSLVFIIFFFCFSFDSIARLYKETI